MSVQVDGVGVEVALQWCSDTFSDLMVGFVNSVKTIDGGTHIEGFKVRLLSAQPFHLHAVQMAAKISTELEFVHVISALYACDTATLRRTDLCSV